MIQRIMAVATRAASISKRVGRTEAAASPPCAYPSASSQRGCKAGARSVNTALLATPTTGTGGAALRHSLARLALGQQCHRADGPLGRRPTDKARAQALTPLSRQFSEATGATAYAGEGDAHDIHDIHNIQEFHHVRTKGYPQYPCYWRWGNYQIIVPWFVGTFARRRGRKAKHITYMISLACMRFGPSENMCMTFMTLRSRGKPTESWCQCPEMCRAARRDGCNKYDDKIGRGTHPRIAM